MDFYSLLDLNLGGIRRKPYEKALSKAAKFKEELETLPKECVLAISPFITESTSSDFFHDIIICSLSTWRKYKGDRFTERVTNLISEIIKRKSDETRNLYNPHKNISIDQCIGDSKVPVSDWFNLTNWSEWE